ncbi:GDP-mannose 4,6-dehydratase [Polynucleobacter sp. 80A-SIGWE]|uniref:GDP-mannose 4,6-dehydratase n=1 Tax=Polynucleobacter sp. 80A-SIGWE TaxID=2689100 RepID=UPI001C0DBA53|nr:GDP-mannose 4,6-dehydratase [Polynucleobacter sp. 80A-SIGWE]MBU3589074.1 GDP-mannose 4,6-dehydratase [Polynucleobacter sp. 80A-SIGWE]
MKTALIFGVTGQDGSYLSELLLKNDFRVIGVKRRSSSINTMRITNLLNHPNFEVVHGDVTDTSSVYSIISKYSPDHIYNLAAQSHVGVSFNEPEYTSQVDGIGTLRILEASKTLVPEVKFYQASTSELYGGLGGGSLNESTPFNPRSPYAAAKLYAYYLVKQYREGYGLMAYNGILFNHESPRRGENFVSRKITTELSNLLNGSVESIYLGNLNSVRDWGHAKDYVEAMMVMLKNCQPDDFVVSTGNCYSVRDFCKESFAITGNLIEFQGEGLQEIGRVVAHGESGITNKRIPIGQNVIKVSPKYFRPLDVPHLLGDSSKFKKASGWEPKYSFSELVYEMVENDVN